MTRAADVLYEGSNVAVVQLPHRRFPGAVIQGDSLKSLCDLAQEILTLVETGTDPTDVAAELRDLLNAHLSTYEEVLRFRGLPLPYTK